MKRYKTILIDPPWDAREIYRSECAVKISLGESYPVMKLDEIAALPVRNLADEGCHLWEWTTNSTLPHAIWLMQHWGFQYMNIVTWLKPSASGLRWLNVTQHLLMGYLGICEMNEKQFSTVIMAKPLRHSEKPAQAYELIERVSFAPSLEIFARKTRPGWDVWGNEVDGIDLEEYNADREASGKGKSKR